jgi:hypothetical protein
MIKFNVGLVRIIIYLSLFKTDRVLVYLQNSRHLLLLINITPNYNIIIITVTISLLFMLRITRIAIALCGVQDKIKK